MRIPELTAIKTLLIGYSIKTEQQLLSKLLLNDFSEMYGNFIFIAEGFSNNRKIIIIFSTAVNANPYYYTVEQGKLLHGKNIFRVFELMQEKTWRWNFEGLYCVANLDHCIAEQSLHAGIKKMPAGSLLIHFDGDAVENITRTTDAFQFNQRDFKDVFSAYESISNDYFQPDQKYVLSLSAGFDSRLLLATALSRDIRPLSFTMGHPEATDVKISARIAKDLGLQHEVITLTEADYLGEATAKQIIEVTSGTKTFAHWHTHIYIQKLNLDESYYHLAGANGEVARSYYFDKGLLSNMLQYIDLGCFRKFFDIKMRYTNRTVLKSIKDQVSLPAILDRMEAGCREAPNTADKFDWFYSFQRVGNFIANGMALYNLRVPTISPFLDERFLRLAFSLKRKYKLNSLFHKKAIATLYPLLMNYGNSENSHDIRSMSGNFYWLKKKEVVSYNLPEKVLEGAEARSVILESRLLDGWLSKADREAAYRQKHYRTLTFLFMFHHTLSAIRTLEYEKVAK